MMKGGAKFGGHTDYMTVDEHGAVVQAGTGTATWTGIHAFATANATSGTIGTLGSTTATIGTANITTANITTLATASTTVSGATDNVRLGASNFFSTGGSATQTPFNTGYDAWYMGNASGANSDTLYGGFPIPANMDLTSGFTPTLFWSRGSTAASCVVDWQVVIDFVKTGTAGKTAASTVDVAGGCSQTVSTANAITATAMAATGAGAASANSWVRVAVSIDGTLTTAGSPNFLGMSLLYSKNKV
jgi:hypothetical protein